MPKPKAADLSAAAKADPAAECASCNHSPAYHDGDGGRCCRAWDPDQDDNFCACKGWKDKPAAAAPGPLS